MTNFGNFNFGTPFTVNRVTEQEPVISAQFNLAKLNPSAHSMCYDGYGSDEYGSAFPSSGGYLIQL